MQAQRTSKEFQSWQIDGKARVEAPGQSRYERMQPYLLPRMSADDHGYNRFVTGEPAQPIGSSEQPPLVKPER